MADIVSLAGKLQPVPTETPAADIIEQLEKALERAKTGNIQGIIMVTDELDGYTGTCRMGVMSYSMIGRLNEMIRNTLAALDD